MPFPAAKSCLQRAKKSSTYSSRFAHDSETAFTGTRLLHRSILTVLVDLPAEVLLVRGVRGAGQQEVVPGLGGPNEIALLGRLVEEGVGAQCMLIAVALVAV